MNYLSLVDAGYAVDTLFSMALQCQVKEAFSATQDKSEAMKVDALTTVVVMKDRIEDKEFQLNPVF